MIQKNIYKIVKLEILLHRERIKMFTDKYVKDIRANYTSNGNLIGFEMLLVTPKLSMVTDELNNESAAIHTTEEWVPIKCYIQPCDKSNLG
jgi:hypothetical protein